MFTVHKVIATQQNQNEIKISVNINAISQRCYICSILMNEVRRFRPRWLLSNRYYSKRAVVTTMRRRIIHETQSRWHAECQRPHGHPANTKHWANVVSMLGQRRSVCRVIMFAGQWWLRPMTTTTHNTTVRLRNCIILLSIIWSSCRIYYIFYFLS